MVNRLQEVRLRVQQPVLQGSRQGIHRQPEEEVGRTFQEGLLNIEFDRVTAIGDIMLIDPQDLKRPKPPVVGEEMSIRPRPEPVRAAPAEAPVEVPIPKAQ